MLNEDIISMPDKWEYPWYAAWDLAFHTLPLSIVDPDFAKQQIELMLRADYLHPNGQMPAYEWNFSDVNPPVHAFATLFLHRTEQALRGETDVRSESVGEGPIRQVVIVPSDTKTLPEPIIPPRPSGDRARLPRSAAPPEFDSQARGRTARSARQPPARVRRPPH